MQLLTKNFVREVAAYVKDRQEISSKSTDLFSEENQKNKKQLENAVAIFKELVLRRKKKLLELAFVSAETGVSKRDFDNMMDFEKESFEQIMRAISGGDKKIEKILNGTEDIMEAGARNKLIIFKQDVEEFLDLEGNKIGPLRREILLIFHRRLLIF